MNGLRLLPRQLCAHKKNFWCATKFWAIFLLPHAAGTDPVEQTGLGKHKPPSTKMSFRKILSLRSFKSLVPIAAALLLAPASTEAAVTVIDFEGLPDRFRVTTEFPGLVFTNAFTGPDGLLNANQFPAFSGRAGVTNSVNPWLAVDFSTPMSSVGGYFTYSGDMTLSFYGAGNVLLGTVPSTYSANYVGSGNAPNEYLQFSSAAGITRMQASNAWLLLDNLTFTAASPVPEPASAMVNLILGGTGIGLTLRRRRR